MGVMVRSIDPSFGSLSGHENMPLRCSCGVGISGIRDEEAMKLIKNGCH